LRFLHYTNFEGKQHECQLLKLTSGRRLLNAAGLDALAVQIASNGTSSCVVKEIALDGHYLDLMRDQRLGRSLLLPGSRVDWLVSCENPGEYKVKLKHCKAKYRKV